jgi:F0F1-type ATP synthase assembly protein I
MSSNNDKDNGGVSWRQAMATVGLTLGIPSMIAVPALIGWYMDKHYGTWPLWFLIWLGIGLLATALDLYKLLKQFGQFK